MTDLADFLLARILEDEVAAREAILETGTWTTWTNGTDSDGDPQWEVVTDMRGKDFIAATLSQDEAVHIARWHPDRILEECASRRALLEVLDAQAGGPETLAETMPVDIHTIGKPIGWGTALTALHLMRLMALPYTEHPDFRDEWWV